jgi:hypothetical protein
MVAPLPVRDTIVGRTAPLGQLGLTKDQGDEAIHNFTLDMDCFGFCLPSASPPVRFAVSRLFLQPIVRNAPAASAESTMIVSHGVELYMFPSMLGGLSRALLSEKGPTPALPAGSNGPAWWLSKVRRHLHHHHASMRFITNVTPRSQLCAPG